VYLKNRGKKKIEPLRRKTLSFTKKKGRFCVFEEQGEEKN